MQDIYELDLIEIGKEVLKYYLILIVVYCGISYAVYSYRYYRARKNIKNYSQNLRKLTQMYDNTERHSS
jgi:hypothetical protein